MYVVQILEQIQWRGLQVSAHVHSPVIFQGSLSMIPSSRRLPLRSEVARLEAHRPPLTPGAGPMPSSERSREKPGQEGLKPWPLISEKADHRNHIPFFIHLNQ